MLFIVIYDLWFVNLSEFSKTLNLQMFKSQIHNFIFLCDTIYIRIIMDNYANLYKRFFYILFYTLDKI